MVNAADLTRVDLNLLVVFQVVLEERHVGRAAARLSLTSSAVSHGLGRLRALLEDPLFLRTPKGVVPTARAGELAAPIADILSRVSHVMESSARFDPASSSRRFILGAPDAVSAVILPRLVADLRRSAPRIDISLRQVFPQHSLEALETRAVDLVITPLEDIPKRFAARVIAEEDFVIAARTGHPFFRRPTLDSYCEQQHILASVSGEPRGFVDIELERMGRSRRIAVVVPHFMMALTALADTDLIAALPRSLVKAQGSRFGLSSVAAPLPVPTSPLRAVVPEVALMDAGLAWLLDRVERAAEVMRAGRRQTARPAPPQRKRTPSRARG
jgi:DNA-binding transcriptional LysR family regulator